MPPQRRSIMGKRKHPEWDGFDEVRNYRDVITHAQCQKCHKILRRRDQETLKKHKLICRGNVENIQNVDNVSSSGSMDFINTVEEFNNDYPYFENENVDRMSKNVTNEASREPSTDMQKSICILKYYIYNNINLDEVRQPAFVKLISSFNESFQVPSVYHFRNNVTEEAINTLQKTNQDKSHLNVICLKIYEADSNFFFLTTLYTNDNHDSPTYIHSKMVYKENKNDVPMLLDTFLTDSIVKTYDDYNIIVKYIIHDGHFNIESEKKVTLSVKKKDFQYTCVCYVGIDYIINKLTNINFTVSMKDHSNLQKIHDVLNNFCSSLKSNIMPLNGAIKKLFALINKNEVFQHLRYTEKVKDVIQTYFDGVHLASNYFEPQDRGQSFAEYPILFELLETYLLRTAPVAIFDALPYYKEKSGYFSFFYAKHNDSNHVRFWNLTKLKNPSIAEYALDLLRLPACTMQLDMEVIYEKFLNCSNYHQKYRSLLFSIIWEYKQ